MAQDTHFSVARGALIADCLPETYEFIENNLTFFYSAIGHLGSVLQDEGDLTFVSNEDQYSFACKAEKAELGSIAQAQGILCDSGQSQLIDGLLSKLSNEH